VLDAQSDRFISRSGNKTTHNISRGYPRFANDDPTACNTAGDDSLRCETRNTKENSWNDKWSLEDTSTEHKPKPINKTRYKKGYVSQVSRAAKKIIEDELQKDPEYAKKVSEEFGGAIRSISHIKNRNCSKSPHLL